MLKQITIEEARSLDRTASLNDVLPNAVQIVEDVRTGKDLALRRLAERFGDLAPNAPLIIEREELARALDAIRSSERAILERTATRIRRFAEAQRAALSDIKVSVEGGFAGHTVMPLERAACYAPGGRYPLPSSVLMTAVTARVAGVNAVWVATPKPSDIMLAAAAVAGADAVLAVGGAHAVAALAYGTESIPQFDTIVGPGNRWVTAAKQLVAGIVKIDMLAGPSELAVVADDAANPAWVAADLLAQAEHDPDARVFLIAFSDRIVRLVERELESQLTDLPTQAIAREAIGNSFCLIVNSVEVAAELCNQIAPEHLSLQLEQKSIERLHPMLRHYGGLFIGAGSAEVLGDYGIGPNHVLPTQGSARARGGLSVFDFLKVQTWMDVSRVPAGVSEDIEALARIEGLEAHRRSMAMRA